MKPLEIRARQMAKAVLWAARRLKGAGKRPRKHLKLGYCLALLSAATRKPLGPADGKMRRQGRREAFKARLLPNVAF